MTRDELQKVQARLPLSAATIARNSPDDSGSRPCASNEKALVKLTKSTDEEKLNKTERDYLAYLRGPGAVLSWIGVQNITLKLAHDTRFTPDFTIVHNGTMRCIDVKGFQREDALIKIKVAARLFPFIKFVIVKRGVNRSWNHKEVSP